MKKSKSIIHSNFKPMSEEDVEMMFLEEISELDNGERYLIKYPNYRKTETH